LVLQFGCGIGSSFIDSNHSSTVADEAVSLSVWKEGRCGAAGDTAVEQYMLIRLIA